MTYFGHLTEKIFHFCGFLGQIWVRFDKNWFNFFIFGGFRSYFGSKCVLSAENVLSSHFSPYLGTFTEKDGKLEVAHTFDEKWVESNLEKYSLI